MSTMLSQVTDTPTIRPPRIVIHGKGGAGKTTFGASAPGAILMPIEDGDGLLTVSRLPRPRGFVDVLNQMAELCNEEHAYRTLVVDTADHLEPLVWDYVCELDDKGKDNIEAFGYGKGYKMADNHWLRFFRGLDVLREKGMTIIVLAHNHTKIIEDPVIGPHTRTTPKLHDRANALLYEWADVVGCMDIERGVVERGEGRKTRTAQTTGQRILTLEDTGAVLAKNRFGLPQTLLIPHEDSYAALRNVIAEALGLGKEAA